MTSTLVWFRRDLRLADHPALTAAAATGPVLGLFVVDPGLWPRGGRARRAWLAASVAALREATGGALVVRYGDPATVVPEVAAAIGADVVHVTGETTPYGRERDARVAAALAEQGAVGRPAGTPYAVDPGPIRAQQGGPYQVFTPFSRAWREEGWDAPLPAPTVEWLTLESDAEAERELEAALGDAPAGMPAAGEVAALEHWQRFLEEDLDAYDDA